LVTSTSEVCLPSPPDFLLMVLDEIERRDQCRPFEAMIVRQRDVWLQPVVAFVVRGLDVLTRR
jgi:hypothetical protein